MRTLPETRNPPAVIRWPGSGTPYTGPFGARMLRTPIPSSGGITSTIRRQSAIVRSIACRCSAVVSSSCINGASGSGQASGLFRCAEYLPRLDFPRIMPKNPSVREALDAIVDDYRHRGDVPRLLDQVAALSAAAPTAELIAAADHYREMHEVAGPIYEVVVDREPENARALVALANAFWLTGRGPEVVGELASRAIAADPSNRGAWHLWALSEGDQRPRVQRWQQVVTRFPDDQLAQANLADNAASLASAENDPVAMKLAIATYEVLLVSATQPAQKTALEGALRTLKNWKV